MGIESRFESAPEQPEQSDAEIAQENLHHARSDFEHALQTDGEVLDKDGTTLLSTVVKHLAIRLNRMANAQQERNDVSAQQRSLNMRLAEVFKILEADSDSKEVAALIEKYKRTE